VADPQGDIIYCMRINFHNPQIVRFSVIYLVAFLFTLHLALPIYINSSFLNTFLTEGAIGIVYAFAAGLTLFALSQYPKVLSRIGNYKTMFWLFATQTALLTTLAFVSSPLVIIPVFILTQILIALGFFNLDVFLERYSRDETTGVLRGIMLTAISVAIFLGPLLAGIILADGDFGKIYLFSAMLILPIFFLMMHGLRTFKDPVYDHKHILARMKQVFFAQHPNDQIRHAVVANLLMRFFFSWMVIYTPIYLNQYMGFSWGEIGIILPIALLPFILFELPIGHIIDRRGNEKNIMSFGFLITAFFTASLFFVTETSLVVWAALLFGTRIGMSLVEIGSESYFFKHVDSGDTNLLSIFRDARPLAWLLGPLLGSILLAIFSMQFLFLALSLVMLYGTWTSARMKQEIVPVQGEHYLISNPPK